MFWMRGRLEVISSLSKKACFTIVFYKLIEFLSIFKLLYWNWIDLLKIKKSRSRRPSDIIKM